MGPPEQVVWSLERNRRRRADAVTKPRAIEDFRKVTVDGAGRTPIFRVASAPPPRHGMTVRNPHRDPTSQILPPPLFGEHPDSSPWTARFDRRPLRAGPCYRRPPAAIGRFPRYRQAEAGHRRRLYFFAEHPWVRRLDITDRCRWSEVAIRHSYDRRRSRPNASVSLSYKRCPTYPPYSVFYRTRRGSDALAAGSLALRNGRPDAHAAEAFPLRQAGELRPSDSRQHLFRRDDVMDVERIIRLGTLLERLDTDICIHYVWLGGCPARCSRRCSETGTSRR